MTNGAMYSLVHWMRYIGLLWVWLLLLFGGAGLGLYFRKTAGGVAMGLGMMGIAVVIMFRWVVLM